MDPLKSLKKTYDGATLRIVTTSDEIVIVRPCESDDPNGAVVIEHYMPHQSTEDEPHSYVRLHPAIARVVGFQLDVLGSHPIEADDDA